jgi:hypothetical protein
MTSTLDQIYAAEYATCGASTHEERHRWATRAVELERSKCVRSMKIEHRTQGNRGEHPHHDCPANKAELRDACEAEARRYYGITINKLRMGHRGESRWFVVCALSYIPSRGHKPSKRGILGSKRAQLIFESKHRLSWPVTQLRDKNREAFNAACAFGATLVATWGTT